jgi:hypothetical protein
MPCVAGESTLTRALIHLHLQEIFGPLGDFGVCGNAGQQVLASVEGGAGFAPLNPNRWVCGIS